MSAITFATVEEAVASTVLPVSLYCRIGGVAVECYEAHISHGVDQPIGTCTVTLGLPRPASLAINAEIEVEAGYPGAVRRRFFGHIPDDDGAIDDNGPNLRVSGVGWASYLAYPNFADLSFDGPISLADVFRGVCEYRNVPTYLADETTDTSGQTIMLGGNENVNGGRVVIAADDSPLDYLRRACEAFGYRIFDSPDGTVRLARVSGLPSASGDTIDADVWQAGDTAITTVPQVLFTNTTLAAADPVGEIGAGSSFDVVAAAIPQPNHGNPTFLTTISDWRQRWNPDGFVYTASRDASVFSDAAGSLLIAITAVPGGTGSLLVYGIDENDFLPAIPGMHYEWTASVRKNHATDMKVVIRHEFFDADYQFLFAQEAEAPNTANTWLPLTVNSTAPLTTRWQVITFGIYNNVTPIGGTRNCYIDAIAPGSNAPRWIEVDHATLGTGWVQAESNGDSVLAAATTTMEYAEGLNAFSMNQRRDSRPMVTYWEVLGARYTDDDGVTVQIRSIPAEVPYAAELDPPGYRKERFSDSENLVTDNLALQARNALEVDRSELFTLPSWECAGHPSLQPGDSVIVRSTSLGISAQTYWLMRIDEDITDRGYIAQMEGWSGGGEALPAGNDCRTETVTIPGDGVAHMGNQTISWYRDTTADGTEMTIDITVTDDDYSSLRLSGIAHGTNTYGTNKVGTPTTGSVIEVWQLEDPTLPEGAGNELRRVGSLELPTLDEEYAKRRNYASSDRYWTAFSLPMPGTLKVGDAELRLISGENDDGQDDYEVTDLELTYCGVGEPVLPGEESV